MIDYRNLVKGPLGKYGLRLTLRIVVVRVVVILRDIIVVYEHMDVAEAQKFRFPRSVGGAECVGLSQVA